jgi:hypothetical protein
LKGDILGFQARYQEAVAEHERAPALDPSNVYAAAGLGWDYARRHWQPERIPRDGLNQTTSFSFRQSKRRPTRDRGVQDIFERQPPECNAPGNRMPW